MRKVIAAINMTLDGFCDHTAIIADDEKIRFDKFFQSLFGQILSAIDGLTAHDLHQAPNALGTCRVVPCQKKENQ